MSGILNTIAYLIFVIDKVKLFTIYKVNIIALILQMQNWGPEKLKNLSKVG